MRILVLMEENGIAHVRESREVFEVKELKLSYTCPGCQTEFIFSGEKSKEKSDPIWTACPVRSRGLKSADMPELFTERRYDQVVLWNAFAHYRMFYARISEHQLPLKLLVTTRELEPAGKPAAADAKP